MAQRVKAEVSALNIRAHPHSAEIYRDLFRVAFSLKQIVKIRGDRSGLITSLSRIGKDDDYIRGVITTFLDFEADGKWFNVDTLEDASDNDVENINIPENLRPSAVPYFFRFDVRNHELVFEHYAKGNRLTHHSALVFFERLFSGRKIVKQFGDIKVTLVQSRGSVDRIFSIPRITDIEIYIAKPNSDIWDGDFEQLTEQHLEDKHARSMTVQYKSERGRGIQRDRDLDALIRASLRNGRTVAKGYGANGHETITTDRFPKVVQDKFDDDLLTESQIFEILADKFRSR